MRQLRGLVANDLIDWYTNEFGPRFGRVIEPAVRAMRGDHVRGVLGQQAIQPRCHRRLGNVLRHAMLERDPRLEEVVARRLVDACRGDGADEDEERYADYSGRKLLPYQQRPIESRRESATVGGRMKMRRGHC